MATDEENFGQKKVSFLPQIRLGDMMTIGSILLASVAWWAKTDAKLARIDEIIVEIKQDAQRQRGDIREIQADLRGDIKELRADVARVSTKIERRTGREGS